MIVGLSGYARSGKDTVAGILVERHAFTRVAFADAIKDLAEAIDPVVRNDRPFRGYARLSDLLHWHDEDALNPGPPEWEFAKTRPEVRRILQALGVACREHIDENIWVDAALGPVGCHDFADDSNRCAISDVRFPNEAEAIVARGGEIWRIVRPGTGPVNGHQSETALDDWPHDRYLPNDGTLEALAAVVAGNLHAARRQPDGVWTFRDLRRQSRDAARFASRQPNKSNGYGSCTTRPPNASTGRTRKSRRSGSWPASPHWSAHRPAQTTDRTEKRSDEQ